jgi:SSS family solute:Na+ symporter
VDLFYGKMKTPVNPVPDLDRAGMESTQRDPHRFDHTKLLGAGSTWEFTRWDRVDTAGFLICCAVSGGIIAFFWFLLRLAAGAG